MRRNRLGTKRPKAISGVWPHGKGYGFLLIPPGKSSCLEHPPCSALPTQTHTHRNPRKGWLGRFQPKPQPMFPKVTKDSEQRDGMADRGLLSPLKVKMKHKKSDFRCCRQLSHREGSETPNFVATTDAKWVDGEKETNPTLKTVAGGCRKQSAGGGARSETRPGVSTLTRTPKRTGARVRNSECKECHGPGRVERI